MIEFIVEGTPRSMQASRRGRAAWFKTVRDAAQQAMTGQERIDDADVSVRILHFCFDWKATGGDLDNIAKLIIDALCSVCFFDDNQVKEILLRRTDLYSAKIIAVGDATPLLAARLGRALEERGRGGFIYLAVATDIQHGRLR